MKVRRRQQEEYARSIQTAATQKTIEYPRESTLRQVDGKLSGHEGTGLPGDHRGYRTQGMSLDRGRLTATAE